MTAVAEWDAATLEADADLEAPDAAAATRTCRVDGCESAPVRRCWYCQVHYEAALAKVKAELTGSKYQNLASKTIAGRKPKGAP